MIRPVGSLSRVPHIPDYEILRRIGTGSYGEVWLARTVMGTFRAVKVIYRNRFDHDRPYEREFEGIRRFEPVSRSHDSQVDIFHIGRNDAEACFYYVMELADDEASESDGSEAPSAALPARSITPETYVPKTLRSVLQRRGRLPFDECLRLGIALATALEHLHRHHLVHRDIKPSNIIYVNGCPKLADVGLVAETERSISFVGTAGYLPPEGAGAVQGDIYSFGKVLYEACIGKDRHAFPELPTDLGALPDEEKLLELNEVLVRACHHDPSQRYPSATILRKELELLKAGISVVWKREVERRVYWAKKGVVAAVLVAVLASGAYLFQRHQTRVAHQNLYVANMNLIQRDWDRSNPGRIAQLLTETEHYPDKGFEWYFWQQQLHLDLRTLHGHREQVTSVAISPNGQRLVTGSEDQSAVVWEVSSGRRVLALTGHTGAVTAVAWSANGERILTSSRDSTVRGWDASHGRQIFLIQERGPITSMAVSPRNNQIITVTTDTDRRPSSAMAGQPGSVRLWDVASGREQRTLYSNAVTCAVFSPDGSRVAIAGGFSAKLLEASSGRELSSFRSRGHVSSMAFAPDGQRLLAGNVGRWAEVWEIASGQQLSVLEGAHESMLTSVAFSPDGQRIATAGRDQRVIVWNAGTGQEELRLIGHRGVVLSLAFTPDGERIATTGSDGTAKIWAAHATKNPRFLRTRGMPVQELTMSGDGRRVAAASAEKAIVWDAESGVELRSWAAEERRVNSISYAPDGRMLATAGGGAGASEMTNAVKLWASFTGELLHILDGHTAVAFSPDGRQVAGASRQHSAKIWDVRTGKPLLVLTGHTAAIQGLAFAPDGSRIATCAADCTLKVWDATSGRVVITVQRQKPEHPMPFPTPVFSPDSERIGVANYDTAPKVFDASTGAELLTLKGHADHVSLISFSPDGRRIITASRDRTAKLWDPLTGRELLSLEGHTFEVGAVVFSPDGRQIITGGNDGAVRVWQAAEPEQVARWRAEEPK